MDQSGSRTVLTLKRKLGVLIAKNSGRVGSTVVSTCLRFVATDTVPTDDPLEALTLIRPAHVEQEGSCTPGEQDRTDIHRCFSTLLACSC